MEEENKELQEQKELNVEESNIEEVVEDDGIEISGDVIVVIAGVAVS